MFPAMIFHRSLIWAALSRYFAFKQREWRKLFVKCNTELPMMLYLQIKVGMN